MLNKIYIVLSILLVVTTKTIAQDIVPCIYEKLDTELREMGTGTGESAFEALTAAINNAMKKIKLNVATQFPEKKLEYSILSKSTTEGEEIELETTLGQPTICNQEIECADDGTNCTATIVINFDISNWLEEIVSI